MIAFTNDSGIKPEQFSASLPDTSVSSEQPDIPATQPAVSFKNSNFSVRHKGLYCDAYDYHEKYWDRPNIDYDAAASDLGALSSKYHHIPFASALLCEIYADICSSQTNEPSPWDGEPAESVKIGA